ncbi:MAG: hypothetical protein AMXMBFR82_39750 [Candidatus Hydrogenedentota bacterium]
MGEEPYPYNQPPWRRSHEATSPDGKWQATLDGAVEIFMSGPTKGTLRIPGLFDIPDCGPDFLWSDDSRYLAVPQWHYRFRPRARIVIVDTRERRIYASRMRYRIAQLEVFANGVLTGVESPVDHPRAFAIFLADVPGAFEYIDPETM